jgi:allantoinase
MEDVAVADAIAAARQTGGRLHILHLSSATALPLIARARREGVPITAETCPHYLALAAEEIPDGATAFKCLPPIRERSNQDLLWRGLRDGVLTSVVSDHSPCTVEMKELERGDFATAWGGISSLQLTLPVMWTAARRRGHTLADVVAWMADGPARLAGLDRKGRIAVGRDADFCVFAPDESLTVEATRLFHRHPVTPYAGKILDGVVRQTILRGEPVDLDQPHGRLLTREAARMGSTPPAARA